MKRDRLMELMELHFDPKWGAPYWIDRVKGLGWDPRKEVRDTSDLVRFGPMDEEVLGRMPLEMFVPKRWHSQKDRWILGETGGTLGVPKGTAFLQEEFDRAFVRPFIEAARGVGFPEGVNWLWVGPGGPHIIGKAARACAVAMGSCDPFSVDFDPRWVKKFARGSLAFDRYLAHVMDQAMRVIEIQEIGVIFSTPRVLEGLMGRMAEFMRLKIRGIHFGGMVLEASLREQLGEAFPNAVFLAGYGNSLLGMMPELSGGSRGELDYYPWGERLVLRLVPLQGSGNHEVAWGEVGRVSFCRLDETMLLLNVLERDCGIRLEAPREERWKAAGFLSGGIRNPGPVRQAGMSQENVQTGLY